MACQESAKLAFSGRRTRHPSNSISGRLAELRERLGEIRNNFSEDTDGAYVLFRYVPVASYFFRGKMAN